MGVKRGEGRERVIELMDKREDVLNLVCYIRGKGESGGGGVVI